MIGHRVPRRPASALAAVLVALVLAACGGGGGGGDHDSPMCTNLSFDRAMVTPGAGDIYMDQAASTCTSLDVVILVSNLTGIFSVSFDLTYPTSALQYQSYSLGPLMLKGNPSTPPSVIVVATSTGIKIVMTRFSPDLPVSATGSEALIDLHFVKTGTGAGPFDFYTGAGDTVTETVLNDQAPPNNTRPAVWTPNHGGMVTIP